MAAPVPVMTHAAIVSGTEVTLEWGHDKTVPYSLGYWHIQWYWYTYVAGILTYTEVTGLVYQYHSLTKVTFYLPDFPTTKYPRQPLSKIDQYGNEIVGPGVFTFTVKGMTAVFDAYSANNLSFNQVALNGPVPVDTTAPQITITTGTDTVAVGSTWTDAGATADTGETVTASGSVDTSTVGTHIITYKATDAAGNTGTKTRTVTVVGPPGQPTLAVPTAGNEQISLSWMAPSDGGESITGYKIEQSTTSATAGFTVAVASTGSTAITKTITDLTNGQQYWFRVSAINSVETGSVSIAQTASPFRAPDPTLQTPVFGTHPSMPGTWHAVLNWSAASNGSTIMGYRVEQSTDGVTWSYHSEHNGVTVLQQYIYLLSFNQAYWWRVIVKASTPTNANGTFGVTPQVFAIDDVISDPVTMGPITMGPPGQPTLAVPTGNAQISLSWTAPSDGGSAITGYTIEQSTTSAAEGWASVANTTAITKTITRIPGLYKYWFRVSATNSVGSGPPSIVVVAMLVPEAPVLTGTTRDGGIRLFWNFLKPSGIHARENADSLDDVPNQVFEFKIEQTPSDSDAWNGIFTWPFPAPLTWSELFNGETPSKSYSGLTNEREYEFTISVRNNAGWGPKSLPLTITPSSLSLAQRNHIKDHATNGVSPGQMVKDILTYSDDTTSRRSSTRYANTIATYSNEPTKKINEYGDNSGLLLRKVRRRHLSTTIRAMFDQIAGDEFTVEDASNMMNLNLHVPPGTTIGTLTAHRPPVAPSIDRSIPVPLEPFTVYCPITDGQSFTINVTDGATYKISQYATGLTDPGDESLYTVTINNNPGDSPDSTVAGALLLSSQTVLPLTMANVFTVDDSYTTTGGSVLFFGSVGSGGSSGGSGSGDPYIMTLL